MMRLDWKELLVAFFLVLIPNGVMLGLALWVDVDRSYINFDYVFVALLLAICSRFLVVPVFICCFFLDALSLVRQIVPVVNVFDSLYLIGFIGVAPILYQVAFFFAMLVMVLLAWMVWRLALITNKKNLVIVVNIFLFLYVANIFFVDDAGATYRRSGGGVISSQAVHAYEASKGGFVLRFAGNSGAPFEDELVSGATDVWMENPDLAGQKVLLIVSESWGVAGDKIQDSVLAPLKNSEFVDGFSQGVLNFSGVTVQGELRELCALRPRHLNLESVRGEFAGCLPNRFKGMGFKTMAVHGAAGSMYGRRQWYPRLGFQTRIFFESKQWGRRCYSFPGACDSELSHEVVDFFRKNEKAFVYWLTLNSHVPYDERDLIVNSFDCMANGIEESSSVCRNLKLHSQFFFYLEKALHSKAMSGVEVVIVGDHEPPLFGDHERSFFDRSKVPWVRFSVGSSR